jgi:hypothetical protein
MDSLESTIQDSIPTQICRKCGPPAQPLTAFHFSRKQCKDCDRASVRRYRQTHKEEKRVYERRSHAAHPEKKRVRDAKYYRNNREKHAACVARSRQKNAEKYKASDRAYRLANLQRRRENGRIYRVTHAEQIRAARKKYRGKYVMSQILSNLRRRARKRELPDTFTRQEHQFMLTYFGFACAVCGNQRGFFWTLHNDHWIPITAPDCPGTVATNMVPLCGGEGSCNNSKNKHDPYEWLAARYGGKKARMIKQRIAAYFAVVATRQAMDIQNNT